MATIAASPSVIVIGVSLGGSQALPRLFGSIADPQSMPPVIIVQHRGRDESALAEILTESLKCQVVEPFDGDPLRWGRVYLTPPNYHLLVEENCISLSTDAAVYFARPSIDVTMESAAIRYGKRCVAIVLTGASIDGAAGAVAVAQRGGTVLIQDPTEAESPVLPAAAAALLPDITPQRLALLAEELARYGRSSSSSEQPLRSRGTTSVNLRKA